ncbi:MAG: ATP synthase F1 subunit gamma [Deltaproteobacteria bacterium]|nr:ATP synthase F1 subunit gamma [Deltaproteobacteria bacterium]
MPSTKEIRRRIRTVQKTKQITSAMRMVSAAKLRRAQDAILAARPYAKRMYAVLGEIGRRHKDAEHPLLKPHARNQVHELIVVTSDRGLCGAFNANVLKRAQATARELVGRGLTVVITPVGKKADEFFRRRRLGAIQRVWSGLGTIGIKHATELAEHLAKRYESGEIDGATLVYAEFVSALTQTPHADPLLPLAPAEDIASAGGAALPFEIEPDANKLLETLVPQALEFTLYRALLENQAGEHAARMAAMENATRNTEELIGSLTLQYNRARQAAITKELMEIVSGAEALK